ncbi:SDR family oxidoreductase [Spirosoma fluminis]
MLPERILITGGSGTVGRETIRELIRHSNQRSFEVVAAVRTPTGGKQHSDVQPDSFVYLDFTDTNTFAPAVQGVDRVLLIRPPQLADADTIFKPFIEALRQAGVRQVVFLSLQGVESNPVTPHHKIEKLIVEAGLTFTFLRPSFFMQNLITTHRDEIRLRNELFIPAGDGRTSFVDVRDIGAVATLILRSPISEHANKSYELTGSEALTYGEVAAVLSKVLGRTITYRNPSILQFVWCKWQRERVPLGFVLVMVALYTVSKLGKAARLTDEAERLLRRRPTTFQQFTHDYRTVWSL